MTKRHCDLNKHKMIKNESKKSVKTNTLQVMSEKNKMLAADNLLLNEHHCESCSINGGCKELSI